MLNYIRKAQARRAEDGASAVEYGLLVAAIAAIIVIIVFALGNIIQGSFKKTCDAMNKDAAGSCNTK